MHSIPIQPNPILSQPSHSYQWVLQPSVVPSRYPPYVPAQPFRAPFYPTTLLPSRPVHPLPIAKSQPILSSLPHHSSNQLPKVHAKSNHDFSHQIVNANADDGKDDEKHDLLSTDVADSTDSPTQTLTFTVTNPDAAIYNVLCRYQDNCRYQLQCPFKHIDQHNPVQSPAFAESFFTKLQTMFDEKFDQLTTQFSQFQQSYQQQHKLIQQLSDSLPNHANSSYQRLTDQMYNTENNLTKLIQSLPPPKDLPRLEQPIADIAKQQNDFKQQLTELQQSINQVVQNQSQSVKQQITQQQFTKLTEQNTKDDKIFMQIKGKMDKFGHKLESYEKGIAELRKTINNKLRSKSNANLPNSITPISSDAVANILKPVIKQNTVSIIESITQQQENYETMIQKFLQQYKHQIINEQKLHLDKVILQKLGAFETKFNQYLDKRTETAAYWKEKRRQQDENTTLLQRQLSSLTTKIDQLHDTVNTYLEVDTSVIEDIDDNETITKEDIDKYNANANIMLKDVQMSHLIGRDTDINPIMVSKEKFIPPQPHPSPIPPISVDKTPPYVLTPEEVYRARLISDETFTDDEIRAMMREQGQPTNDEIPPDDLALILSAQREYYHYKAQAVKSVQSEKT